jgi:hypothetical protein
MNNRPIDKVRNSGLSITLPADTGGITDMGEINGALHMIGGSAIYRVQLADEIDPERTNIAVPNTHQKVLSYGTDFAYVRQTLMTARRLFSNKVLGPAFNYKSGINLSFEALQDLAAMYDIRKNVRARFDKIAEDLQNVAVERRSMTVPSMGDVRGESKAFLQKADHVAVALFNVAKLFYGDEIGPRWFASLQKLASEKYGENNEFTKFLNAVLPFLQFVRNARNAVEHPDQAKRVKVTDIALLPSGALNPPSIEVIHPETPQPSVPLLALLEHVADQLAAVFEIMLAHLCGANVQPVAGMPLGVMEYDENQQRAFKCRYGYATRMGDQIVPFG